MLACAFVCSACLPGQSYAFVPWGCIYFSASLVRQPGGIQGVDERNCFVDQCNTGVLEACLQAQRREARDLPVAALLVFDFSSSLYSRRVETSSKKKRTIC